MSENCNHNCEGCQADCGSRKADFKQPANKYSHIKKVIGVVSGKGGVGKSLVTCLKYSQRSEKFSATTFAYSPNQSATSSFSQPPFSCNACGNSQ